MRSSRDQQVDPDVVPLMDNTQATDLDSHSIVPPSSPHAISGAALNPRSCVTCRKRKVRCDKVHPCTNCTRAHTECIFPAPGRAPRKVRKLGDGKDKELLERLRRLEGVVKGMGVDIPGDGSVGLNNAPLSTSDNSVGGVEQPLNANVSLDARRSADGPVEEQSFENALPHDRRRQDDLENSFGRLVVNEGKSRYVNDSFWASLSNEVEDLKGILNESSDENDAESTPGDVSQAIDNHQSFVFGFSSQSASLLSLHSTPKHIGMYWEVYKDRVDPLVKVLHIPSVEPNILNAAVNLAHVSKAFETLLFSIYYGAVTSLSDTDCRAKFGEGKDTLLNRYRFAVEQALARANFLTTQEIVVLQAFVIFLICLRRNSDARAIWTLTGIALRIAQTLGLHRDGSHFRLSPFEIEMRRRLWWQVGILDTRASEDHGCDPSILEQTFDTKLPLNINDADITPGMKDFPPERQGCTDMTFCLIRYEVANTFRRIVYIPPGLRQSNEFFSTVTLERKETWISECHERLEERYLKHCDMTVPLYWVTATVARLMMSKMWLLVYHPFQRQDGGASLPAETKDKLFITSLENVEYSLLLETEARTMKWGWLFKTYIQWHALAFILSELCVRTQGDLVDRAWTAIEKTKDGRWSTHKTAGLRAGQLWRPIDKLYRKARDSRQRAVQAETLQQTVLSPDGARRSLKEHVQRPTMVRAPLSQAQLDRIADGPLFGKMPIDKHELFRSLSGLGVTTSDQSIDKALAMTGTNADMPQFTDQPSCEAIRMQPQSYPKATFESGQLYDNLTRTVSSQQAYPPSIPIDSDPQAYFANANAAWTGGASRIGRNDPHKAVHLPSFNPIDGNIWPNQPWQTNMMDLYSTNGNNIDISSLNNVGEVDWQNWDQLVQPMGMGMDVDSGAGVGVAADWAGVNWETIVDGQNQNLSIGMNGHGPYWGA